MGISLITCDISITQKSYSTLRKGIDIGNISLENTQNPNPTLKTITIRLKLVKGWQNVIFNPYSPIYKQYMDFY